MADCIILDREEKKYATDVALMTVTDTEYNAVMYFHDWQTVMYKGDDQRYQIATFERDGKEYSLVHVKAGEMGMPAAGATTMKAIYDFRPHYVIMVGIAAGVALSELEEQIYGDVIVPDIVWNYSAGKFVSPDNAEISYGEVGFLPRPRQVRIPERVMPYIRKAAESEENECHVYIGPMACGSSVVANRKFLESHVHSQNRQTAGLDMESYAVAYACIHATKPRPTPIIIKSVCDYGDSQKSDQYQKFAAFTSCQFAHLLYTKYLPL